MRWKRPSDDLDELLVQEQREVVLVDAPVTKAVFTPEDEIRARGLGVALFDTPRPLR